MLFKKGFYADDRLEGRRMLMNFETTTLWSWSDMKEELSATLSGFFEITCGEFQRKYSFGLDDAILVFDGKKVCISTLSALANKIIEAMGPEFWLCDHDTVTKSIISYGRWLKNHEQYARPIVAQVYNEPPL